MADRKITDLTALAAGSQATGDLLTIVDVSEGAAADKNKKITVESLFNGIPSNVGIGATATQQALTIDVNDSGTTQASFNGINIANTNTSANNGSAITFGQTVSGNSNARIGVIQTARGPSESQEMFFGLLGSGSYSERMRIDSSGVLSIKDSSGSDNISISHDGTNGNITNNGGEFLIYAAGSQNMIFHTNSTERLRIQSGGGISFNGDTAAANALDDYEEGTFTPSFTQSGYTYSNQFGRYTKIGNRVLFNIFLSWTANTASGNAAVQGFAYAVPNELQYYGAAAITNNSITLPSGSDNIVAQISPTAPQIVIYAADSGTSKQNVPNSSMGSTGEVVISGQYSVA